jgi:hypothetical protein
MRKNFKFENEKQKEDVFKIIKQMYLMNYKRKSIFQYVKHAYNINPHMRTFDKWYVQVEKLIEHSEDDKLMMKWRKEYQTYNRLNKEEKLLEELYEIARVKGYLKGD